MADSRNENRDTCLAEPPSRVRTVTPIIQQAIDDIRDMIIRGDVRLGGRLFPEREMADRLCISRSTVRAALDEMHASGEIESRRGRNGGTFVAKSSQYWARYRYMNVTPGRGCIVDYPSGFPKGFPKTFEQQGFSVSTDIIGASLENCPVHIASLFGSRGEHKMFRIERVRFADEVPISFETTYVSPNRFPDFLENDFNDAVYDILQDKYGVRFGRINERISVSMVVGRCARYLGVESNQPVLSVLSWGLDTDGEIVEVSKDLYRADRVRLMVSNNLSDNE